MALIQKDIIQKGKSLKREYTILIADRNSNVREFLKREMVKEGFRVIQAEKARDVIKMVYQYYPLDLVLLDPNLTDMEKSVLLKKIASRIPPLPVIVHAFDSDDTDYFSYLKQDAFVEKGGQSIEKLKKVVWDMLEKN